MEYSRTSHRPPRQKNSGVLILILMEYPLTCGADRLKNGYLVLILILMEYSLTLYQRALYDFSFSIFPNSFPL